MLQSVEVSDEAVALIVAPWATTLVQGCNRYMTIFEECPNDWHMRRILGLPEAKQLDQLGKLLVKHWKSRPGILLP